MNLSRLILRSALRARLPVAVLAALLQRTPMTRALLDAGDWAFRSPLAAVLRSGTLAAASLGALDALAGATTIVPSSSSPTTVTVAAGVPMNPVVFGLSGSSIEAGSWSISGNAWPAGLNFSGLTSAGSVNTPNGYGELSGTPTTAGSYFLAIQAFEYPADRPPSSSVLSYTVVVTATNIAPAFTLQPNSLTIAQTPTTVVFSAAASGFPAPTYQWRFNNSPIAGATSPRLVVSGATTAGNYTCVATNSAGNATSQAAVLTVQATSNPGRLGNLSVLTAAGNGSKPLTVGFEVGGAGTGGTQTLLLRGDGPLLAGAPFNQTDTLADPVIQLFAQGSGTVLATNDNWGTNQAAVTAAEANTYAFPLANGSLDAALVSTLASGSYSVQLTGNPNGAGSQLALAEVYDDTASGAYSPSTPRLINLSSLAQVNAGAGNALTAGFVVGGATAKTVLIRAWGPALTPAPFSVAGAMPDPQLQVYSTASGDILLAANAGWGGDPQIAAAASAVYAYAWSNPGSADSAVLITLPPGNYTAQVSSPSGAGGTALIEVFEDP